MIFQKLLGTGYGPTITLRDPKYHQRGHWRPGNQWDQGSSLPKSSGVFVDLPCGHFPSSFFFFFFLRFIYLFLAVLGLCCCTGFSLVAASRGYCLLWCTSFLSQWLLLFWSSGSVVVVYRLSCPAAATSLQSCPTLYDPIDSRPPGFPSLGFSRQEHWSGLPFPFPMHESEK